jgi:O-antigen/teichoic acid export membrane protein
MAAGFPAAPVLVFAQRPIAALLVGGGMAPAAAAVLPWLAAGALLSGLLALHFGLAFQITRRTTWMLAAVVPAAALNLAANGVLLPRYGVMAAAWTTLGSYAVATALAIALGRRHFAVPFPARDALRTAAACVPLALFVRLEPFSTAGAAVLVLAAAAAVYAVSAFALDVAGVRRGAAPGS